VFDPFYEAVASALNFFYSVTGSFALSIAVLTLVIMIVLTPFTLKGTKSMIQIQRLQPEMKRLQQKYKDDRQKLNEELLAFYKEHNVNPLGGCLPMLLQAPVFMLLFRVIRGITHVDSKTGLFVPEHLTKTSELYKALVGKKEMLSFGIDLSQSASKALAKGFTTGLPYLAMVAVVAFSAYYQQKQVAGRNPGQEIPSQQKMLMRIFPLMFIFFSYASPAALVVYFITSNLYRIGQQGYITRSLYTGEESLGAQAARAAKETKELREAAGEKPGLLDRLTAQPPKPTPKPTTRPAPANGAGRPANPQASARPPGNRSRKKKKRR
jgi:YidC/Oxa1 family membrane protein insertase